MLQKRENLNEVWFAGDGNVGNENAGNENAGGENAGVDLEKSVERVVKCAKSIMRQGGLRDPSS